MPDDELVLAGCQGWTAYRNHVAPGPGGDRPAGWPEAVPGSLFSVSIDLFRCDRVHIGPFERGPLHLLFESHGNAEPPAACASRIQGTTRLWVLHQLLVDDAELAAFLRSAHGMPAGVAAFQETVTLLPGGAWHAWTWETDGQASGLRVLDEGQGSAEPRAHERFFWGRGDGVSMLELAHERDGPSADGPSEGTLRPPMLLASETAGRFVGQASWHGAAEASGPITHFGDAACKEST